MFCKPCLPGPQGHMGFQGICGSQGIIGSQGYQGVQGPQGTKGYDDYFNNTIFIVNDDIYIEEWQNGTLYLVDSSNKEITITLANINVNPITIRMLYKRGMNVIVQCMSNSYSTTSLTSYDSEKTFLFQNGSWKIINGYETNSFYPTTQQGEPLIGTDYTGDNIDQGYTVSLSADGNTLAVGGLYDNNGIGATWIFVRNNGIWTQQDKLIATGYSGTSPNPNQGSSVSLSADGNTLAVGGYLDNSYIGATWIFTRNSGIWIQESKLVGTGNTGTSYQGWSVSLSADGNTLAVGGPYDGKLAPADPYIGATWIFIRNNGTWNQQGNKIIGSNIDITYGYVLQGTSVSLSADGNTLAVGGPIDGLIGATWIFTRNGTVWTQQGEKLVGNDYSGFSNQGWSVSLSSDGDTLAIGGFTDNNYIGATWIFTRNGTYWNQQGEKLVANGYTGTNIEQGYSVSLSSDGNTLAIGGYYDNNGTGAVWTFLRKDTVWIQQNKFVVSGEMVLQGWSVSISSDGSTLASGGPGWVWSPTIGSTWIFT